VSLNDRISRSIRASRLRYDVVDENPQCRLGAGEVLELTRCPADAEQLQMQVAQLAVGVHRCLVPGRDVGVGESKSRSNRCSSSR